ncbi:TraR/DksA C4-type zinc finger protein [Bacillus sp. T33-2]|uniref:TraR/DksA C4-type zinc finger protein n=1 Tax=Bacillus sp. T33-2 TaxID=2054168 RepID=UPI000C75E5BD|nr:TraR/DksA C4-type zinc finger protein [Bacillus sp. T33-2]PLR97689.1 hypothetical protein CVD19_09495 [Bacillus sp. T33-2]
MLTNEQLAAFRAELVKMKKDFEGTFDVNDHFNLNSSLNRETSIELSAYDNHPGDEGTELFEREKDLALNQHLAFRIENADRAIQAIDNGTYGKCEECGEEIPLERLQAVPETTFCIKHTPERTIPPNRPIEEGVLLPPFGKWDKDEKDENVVTDAEDFWQAVASFGTSETASDFFYTDGRDHRNDWYIEAEDKIGYVEAYENFAANDMYGNEVVVYPNVQHLQYEEQLDEEGLMTPFGDLPAFEHDPYTEEAAENGEEGGG